MMNEDWDICIILDGCRYDLFDEVWDGDEEVNKVESRVLLRQSSNEVIFTGTSSSTQFT